jgi:RNA polymerase sigma-32 factor
MQDYILRNWSIVRGGTSSSQKALFFQLRRLRATLTRGGEERIGEVVHAAIAARIGVSRADVAAMDARLSGPDISLNAPVGEDDGSGSERMNLLPDNGLLPDEVVGDSIDSDRRLGWLQAALAVLSERELKIVRERRLAEETCTLDALGRRLGISKERVRQIENRALEKLRRALLASHPQGSAALI